MPHPKAQRRPSPPRTASGWRARPPSTPPEDREEDTLRLLLSRHRVAMDPAVRRVRHVVICGLEIDCAPGAVARAAESLSVAGAPVRSYHYLVGPDEVILGALETDATLHTPGLDASSISIALASRVGWTATDWRSDYAEQTLRRSAALVARVCTRWRVDPRWLEPWDLLRGEGGLVERSTATEAGRLAALRALETGLERGRGKDPGAAFPRDAWIVHVGAAMR